MDALKSCSQPGCADRTGSSRARSCLSCPWCSVPGSGCHPGASSPLSWQALACSAPFVASSGQLLAASWGCEGNREQLWAVPAPWAPHRVAQPGAADCCPPSPTRLPGQSGWQGLMGQILLSMGLGRLGCPLIEDSCRSVC